jgi:ribonuclease P protein component
VARYTFRRRDRIPEGEDFVRTVRRGPAARTGHLRVHARANGLGHSRLGISVGRKFGKAVQRNRLKRLVREAFRTSDDVRGAGLDLVVVAQDRAVLECPEEILDALRLAAMRFAPASSRAPAGRAGHPPGSEGDEEGKA